MVDNKALRPVFLGRGGIGGGTLRFPWSSKGKRIPHPTHMPEIYTGSLPNLWVFTMHDHWWPSILHLERDSLPIWLTWILSGKGLVMILYTLHRRYMYNIHLWRLPNLRIIRNHMFSSYMFIFSPAAKFNNKNSNFRLSLTWEVNKTEPWPTHQQNTRL